MSKYDFYFETEGVVTLVDKMDFFWVLPGGGEAFSNFSSGGMLMLVQLWLVRVASKCEVAYDELDGTHNKLDDLEALWGHKRLAKVSLFTLCQGGCLN